MRLSLTKSVHDDLDEADSVSDAFSMIFSHAAYCACIKAGSGLLPPVLNRFSSACVNGTG